MSDLPLIVFDCNETLLDLETITSTFERIFGDRATMRLWFEQLITFSQALTISDIYLPFTDIGSSVLAMIAEARGIRIAGSRGRGDRSSRLARSIDRLLSASSLPADRGSSPEIRAS